MFHRKLREDNTKQTLIQQTLSIPRSVGHTDYIDRPRDGKWAMFDENLKDQIGQAVRAMPGKVLRAKGNDAGEKKHLDIFLREPLGEQLLEIFKGTAVIW
jgi:hypothetical protein